MHEPINLYILLLGIIMHIVLFAISLRSRRTTLLPVLLLFFFPFRGIAQLPGKYFLENLDNRNGLSNSAINYIYKDHDNLLWIATWDGLNMYDGSSFHVFNYSKETDSASIGNNVIQRITEDKQQNIWVTTIEGVSRYEKRSGKFYNYFYQQHQRGRISEQEFELVVDTSGKVFCLTQKQGLTLYDPVNDTFAVYSFPRHPSKVRQLAFDASNRLWLLNNNGELETFSWNGRSFGRLNTLQYTPGIARFFIVNNRIFFSTADDRLLEIGPGGPVAIPDLELKQGVAEMMYYQGHYLLALNGSGFVVYDNQFRSSSFLQTEANHLQHIRISSWAAGSEQILWYGTDGNGIIKLYPQTKPFGTVATSDSEMASNKPVRAFCEKEGSLWVGTKGSGIIEIEKFWSTPAGEWKKRYYTAASELNNNAVFALKKGVDGRIYIGTDGKGVGIYDLKEKKFYRWNAIKGFNNYPEFGSVYAILPDKDSSVWLGTSGYGLVHLKLYNDAGQPSVQLLERYTFNNNTGPANDIIYALAEGDEDHLWIACRYGGLSLLDKRTRHFRDFKAFTYEGSLTNNDVLSLYRDSKNRIWIGTSYGLNYIDQAGAKESNPVFRKFTTANGLPNNTIHAIEEDAQGQIWVSTNKGLAKVDPSTMSVAYYQQTDGLQSNEFCDGAVWKDAAGYLFMGGVYGFNYFLPREIRNTDWHPDLLLSNVLIGGKSLRDNGFVVFKPGDQQLQSYVVERKDGLFELDVRAISFLNAGKCEYAWYLDGHDQAWHPADNSGKITYSNIAPGNYTLKIKWSNGEGAWTEEVPMMHLRVKQYFWLTPPAILVYTLLTMLIGFLFYRYRKNRQKIKNQLAIEHLLRLKEEELHQGQLGFFTNIAHELQTPLTLILGSAERLQNHQASAYTSLLQQQASRLTYLVQQLLDIRKAEAGFSNIQLSFLDLSELLTHLSDPFLSLGDQQGKILEREIRQGISTWIDKDKLEKIVFNLLSNAFKHSGKNSRVQFCLEENTSLKMLEIKVANSGVDLSPEQLQKLFDEFYVASFTGGEKFGTGIGLAFTRQLVTMLNGRIEARSEAGWIWFIVSLPLTVVPGDVDTQAALRPVSNTPSYLYQSLTAYQSGPAQLSAEESNKLTFIGAIEETDKKIILVVEDEPSIRYLLKDALIDYYIIYEAENGREALDLLNQVAPDCIISDVMMPDMDGLEFCTRIKNTPATCQIPFIMLSAKGNVEERTEGYEVGADAYIAKPFHISHLLVRIRKLLEYRQRLNDLFKANSTIDYAVSDIPDADKQFIDSLVKAIEAHLDEEEFNAAVLEKELSLSKMQLYRKLKTMTNMTPGEFIRHIRLKHAAHLLASTNLTVSEIFYRTGFNNQSYFFREFRKRYQCAPNEYRAQQTVQD